MDSNWQYTPILPRVHVFIICHQSKVSAFITLCAYIRVKQSAVSVACGCDELLLASDQFVNITNQLVLAKLRFSVLQLSGKVHQCHKYLTLVEFRHAQWKYSTIMAYWCGTNVWLIDTVFVALFKCLDRRQKKASFPTFLTL